MDAPVEEIRKNKKLMQFPELKETVIAKAVKNVPCELKGKKDNTAPKTLLEFS